VHAFKISRLLAIAIALLALFGCNTLSTNISTDLKTNNSDVHFTLTEITPELIAQQQHTDTSSPAINPLLISPKNQSNEYRIARGDVLKILVWNHPDLVFAGAGIASLYGGPGAPPTSTSPTDNSGFIVSENGDIQFPLLGRVAVSGLTTNEARESIAKQLNAYINTPSVLVQVLQYRGKRIHVDGAVKTPGTLNINDIAMTLPEAIARASGLDTNADTSSISLFRNHQEYKINLRKLTKNGVNPDSIVLQDGDLLRVSWQSENPIAVLGEVRNPGMRYRHNGSLSLNEALTESGGLDPIAANAGQIYVVRRSTDTEARVYHIACARAENLVLADAFPLENRDIVVVNTLPLAQWNRVIALIFASVSAAETTNNTVHNR
jgi:polysaccharide biosynthesis/export protein